MMANSSIREIRVATAAPYTYIYSKMNTQLRKVLAHMETASTYIPTAGRPMLRWALIYTSVRPLKT